MIVRDINIKSTILNGTVKLFNVASHPWVNAHFFNYNDREKIVPETPHIWVHGLSLAIHTNFVIVPTNPTTCSHLKCATTC